MVAVTVGSAVTARHRQPHHWPLYFPQAGPGPRWSAGEQCAFVGVPSGGP